MFNFRKIPLIDLSKKQIISLLFVAFSFKAFAQQSIYENSDILIKSNDLFKYLESQNTINRNKAFDALHSLKIDSAEFYYAQSRKAFIRIDSSNVYKNDCEFYLACASTCMSINEKVREANKVYFEMGLDYYNKAIATDSNNYKATHGIMVAYYNDAVTELRKADYCKQVEIANSVDWSNPNQEIPSIEKLLECIKPEEFEKYNFTPAIEKALPFALKAYKINPTDKIVVEALIGIHYAMNDRKSVSKYRNELKKLK